MILSVVIPCWNEAEGVAGALATASEAAEAAVRAGYVTSWEVVVVDDGSDDGTAAIVSQAASLDDRIRLVAHSRNRGLGAAIRTGLAAARGDIVLYIDADLPCDVVHDLAKALRLLRVYRADIVTAYRHDRTGEGPRRALYSGVYNTLVRSVFRLPVRDVNFAFKLMRRPVVDAIDLKSDGSFIDAELMVRANRRGFRTIQFGVDYFPRTRGVSTLSSSTTITKIFREMVMIGPEAARARRPAPAPLDDRVRPVLVVNADDYGLTAGVSRGILRAHTRGIVTSTSVLVLGRGFSEASGWLGDLQSLDVGVHLAAVGEDPPLLSAREIPTLVDRRGHLPRSWAAFIAKASRRSIDAGDLEREFGAQVEAARGAGVPLSHVDTHQHLHLWPSVTDTVIKVAKAHGIPAMRVPRSCGRAKSVAINALAARVARRAGAAGLAHTEWSAGLDQAGHMYGPSFREAVSTLATRGRTAELNCHPGERDEDRSAYRWGYDWDRELHWLTSREARAAVDEAGFVLGTYRDLAPATSRT